MATKIAAYLARPDIRNDRVTLIARRIRYELESRLYPSQLSKQRIVRFDGDLRIALRLTQAVDRSIYLYGLYEFRTATLFKRLIEQGMSVVDVGAHIGQYTLLAAKRVGPRGKVLAVEPNPENVSRLEGNLRLNRLGNVSILPAALSSEDGQAMFHLPSNPESAPLGSLLVPTRGSFERYVVDVRRFDSINPAKVDLVKIDVEGVEDSVVAGGIQAFREWRPIVIFEHFSRVPTSTPSAIHLLKDLGFRIFGIGSDGVLREILSDDPWSHKEPWYPLNLVAVHPDSAGWRHAMGAEPVATGINGLSTN